MSAIRTLKRGIAIRYTDRMGIIRAAQKPDEYLKHRAHQKRLLRELKEETENQKEGPNA